MRSEWEQNNELVTGSAIHDVGELTLGGIHDWKVADHFKFGLGASYTFDFVPSPLTPPMAAIRMALWSLSAWLRSDSWFRVMVSNQSCGDRFDIWPQLLLIGAVAGVGILHTMVPDHWAPIALIARQQGWTRQKTAGTALKAGTGMCFRLCLLRQLSGSLASPSRSASAIMSIRIEYRAYRFWRMDCDFIAHGNAKRGRPHA